MNTPELSPQEIRALRSMPEFQKALKVVRDKDAAELAEMDRQARKRADEENTMPVPRHLLPHRNPNREDGLYGKAAQAADGDWYDSH